MIPTEQINARFISSLIRTTYDRIQSMLVRTRIVEDAEHHLFLKCENEQATGSFKLRGALSKLSSLPQGSQVVTASTGNHGLGVAKAANYFNHDVKVFIPNSASSQKREKLLSQGVDLELVDGDSLEAELAGQEFAALNQLTWVSPYNDVQVIAGQGTIGLELLNQLESIDKVYVTVGGGGLISGIASWIKTHSPDTEIIGCQPVNSPEMYLSQLAGHVVDAPDAKPTLSDGSAGPLEEDSITFLLCRDLVDRYILINEEEIKSAIRYVFEKTQHGD